MEKCKTNFDLMEISNVCIFENEIYMVWVDTYVFDCRYFIHNPVQEIYHGFAKQPLSLNLN